MPRRLHLLALLLLATLSLLAWPTQAAPAPAPANLTLGDVYLALGDSLGTGAEAAVNNDGQPGYPVFLHQ
ncbi:MAG: hypothetical protein AB4911_12945, partial [Oscillochloridaceae bacterium umkhey_bin13]